ncbi:MAG: phosphoadenylyl-sulfate reductase, partial [Opitutales bacterium]
MQTNNEEFAEENAELAKLNARGRVAWALERFGEGLVMSTSFGLQSAVMLHLVREVSEEIPIIFVDTGYLFPETYEYAELLRDKLGVRPKIYSSGLSPLYQQIRYGRLWKKGSDGMEKYNLINKVEPMQRGLRELGATAWLAGLRREQSTSRAERTFIEKQNGVAKIYPILDWDDKTAYKYLPDNDLPYHALEGKGYDSVG